MVWPQDAARKLVWEGGTASWFWIHMMQAIAFTVLAVWAFQRLASVSMPGQGSEAKPA